MALESTVVIIDQLNSKPKIIEVYATLFIDVCIAIAYDYSLNLNYIKFYGIFVGAK